MRTTVIPAQVTTIEDTIAGNLTLTQILLLLAPVLISTAIYIVLPIRMAFTIYKIPLIIVFSLFFIILSLKIKGKLVLNWLVILFEYQLRPHLYVFNKNTLFCRELVMPPIVKKNHSQNKAKIVEKIKNDSDNKQFDFETIIRDQEVNLRFTKSGLLVVKNI
jgi:hypothetical protein